MNEDDATPEGDAGPAHAWGAGTAAAGGAEGPGTSSQPGTSLPPYAAGPARRRSGAFLGVAVGTVLALGAGAFAVASLADDGHGSPEAAVEALFAAVEDRDVLGALDTMAPGEREVYQPFVEDAVGELQRLQVLSEDLDLGDVAGFEVDVEGLTLESEVLGDGIAVVRLTGGTITSSVDPRQVPVGSFVRELMDDPDSGVALEPVTSTEDLAADEPVEIVVIDDGGWHVSLHYSIAEAARKEAGAPLPAFGAGVAPDGAASPEEAVRALVEASVDLDVRRAIALLPPGEMSALHDYAPLFLDDAEQAVADLRAESDFEVSIDALDMTSEVDDGVGHVTVTAFAASGRVDGEAFSVAYDGECLSVTAEGEVEEVCTDDPATGPGGLAAELADVELTVLTVERDGAWYVSPTRTLLEYGLVVLRALEPADLEDPAAFLEEGFGLAPMLFGLGAVEEVGSSEGAAVPTDDPYAECGMIYEDLAPDATDEEWAAADDAVERCYDEVDGVDRGGADPGAVDPYEVCSPVYDDLGPDPTAEEVAEADKAYGACYDDVVGSS